MDKQHIQSDKFPHLAYRKAGKGPAIVLLHGFPEDGELWSEVWPTLSLSYTVIVPDLPGSGDSRMAGTEISMEDMAESVKHILDKEEIGKAVVVGHSMGGYAALAFADMYGGAVAGISMVHSVATADDEEKKETRRKAIALIEKGGREAFIKQMVPGLFSEKYKQRHPDAVKQHIEKGLQLEGSSLVAFYNAMIKRPDRTSTLAAAGVPVQWIAGAGDTIATPEKMMQQSRLANVNFVSVYEDSAHMSMVEEPQRLVKDLQEFGRYCFK